MEGKMIPTVLWAQRKDKVLLTVDVQEAVEPKISITNEGADEEAFARITFRGSAQSSATGKEPHSYELDLELVKAVNTEESKVSVNPRSVVLVLAKRSDDQTFWPRLLKSKGKNPHIKVDWDKWVDEDDEEVAGPDSFDLSNMQDFSNFDMGGMGGMGGGLGGMGGMGAAGDSGLGTSGAEADEEDSDDEDLPGLEAP